jgi:vancomycin resistance protein YoaR
MEDSEMSEHNEKTRTGRKSKGFIVLIWFVCIAVAGFGIYQYARYRAHVRDMEAAVNVNVFYDGISIGGVAVGGMTREEAMGAVQSAVAERLNVSGITITYGDKQWVFTQNDLRDSHNLDAVLDKAWAVGRSGKLRDRYQQVVSLQAKGKEFDADIVYSADTIARYIDTIDSQVSNEAVGATVSFDPTEEPMFTFTDEVYGKQVDINATMAVVRKKVKEQSWGEVELIVDEIEPAVLRSQLEPLETSIVDFSTSIKGNTKNRANNVRQALANIDGHVVMPGEIFSFNEVVGKRTEENGFLEAPIINRDKALVPGMGGGVCQASTTTYNAVLRAGMEIVERHHHSFPVGYIAKGLDATVSWGAQDLKFKNTRETPVYIHTYYENHNVHVQIFGLPYPDKGQYKCWSEVTGTVKPPATIVRADHNGKYVKAPGQYVQYVEDRSGYKVTAYQGYYEDGELVKKTVLNEDYYRPIQGVILCYPGEEHMDGDEVVTKLPH